jgi:uncharacterized RDD family membrane protein YckC
VVSGEAVAVDLQLAGPGSRGIAAAVDLLIMGLATTLVLVVVFLAGVNSNPAVLITVLLVAELGVLLGYPIASETLWRGRTVGKAVMGLRVVRDDGGPIRFRHALVRGLVGAIVEKPGFSYGLIALLFMIGNRRNKRLGDLAAGTVVLQDRVPGRIDVPVWMPPELAGWASTLDLSQVDEGLALRLRQFVMRANQLSPQARAGIEGQLVQEVVSRVGPPPAGAPPWAVLSAVLAERRQRSFAATQPAEPPPTFYPPAPPPAAPPTSPGPGGFTPPS